MTLRDVVKTALQTGAEQPKVKRAQLSERGPVFLRAGAGNEIQNQAGDRYGFVIDDLMADDWTLAE